MITPLNIIDNIKNAYYDRLHEVRRLIDKALKKRFTPEFLDYIAYRNIMELKEVIKEYEKEGWSITWLDEIKSDTPHKIKFFYDIPSPCKELGNIVSLEVDIPFISIENI